jgi:hypothetical protein
MGMGMEGESPFRVAGEPRKELPPAPRPTSKDLARVLRYGTGMAQLGWTLATAGAVLLMVGMLLVESPWQPFDTRANAEVRAVIETSTRWNDAPVDEVHYTFTDAHGAVHRGTSYTTGGYQLGGSAVIEYAGADPADSRLVGGHQSSMPLPWWLLPPMLLFAGVGFAIAIRAHRRGSAALYLLQRGLPASGKLVARRPSNVQVNGRDLEILTFEYTVKSVTYRVDVRPFRTEALEDQPLEPMLYDPEWPKNATTLDHLPGAPVIRADGTLAADAGFVYHLLILPAAAGLAAAATVAILVTRIVT